MIGWGDVYKVVAAMAALYFALGLGYGSVRWWKLFTPDQCDAVNRLMAYFAVPFFAFDFAVRMDPYALNYRVLAADALSKLAVVLALAAWAAASTSCCTRRGDSDKRGSELASSWCITGFSLATLNNTLVVGVPLLDAMYGGWARDLVVQISVVQIIVYFPPLVENGWHIQTPSIIEGSVLTMSRTGVGLAMFSMGLFMALQEKIIVCGAGLTALGMALRFVAGPAATAAGAVALGLRGDVLRLAIIQPALPQSITTFVFAKEYGLHADVLSTA
ncbi:hypothetical protein ACQ4PT_029010 [Festuca glaucescens]